MTIKEIIEYLESFYPKKNAEEWDNVGLLLGNKFEKIRGIAVSLDLDMDVIKFAEKNNLNLIITHHPFIFSPLKNIDLNEKIGEKIEKLIKNNISVYTMHTNIDSTKGGLNDFILEKLNVFKSEILNPSLDKKSGIGRIYKIKEGITPLKYSEILKEKLNLDKVFLYSNNPEKLIKKIAFINGAGSSFWKKSKFKGVDFLITGDAKYHDIYDILENNMSILDLGHYSSEKFFMELIENKLLAKIDKQKIYVYIKKENIIII